MRRYLLATAAASLLTVTACGSEEPDDEPIADAAVADGETPIVPVEVSTDLMDAEGSVLGSAWFRDAETGGVAEVEVQVAGMTEGFHGMLLYAVGSCDAVGPDVASQVLPPLLVLESGIGSMTTLVGPVSLGDMLEDDGVTLVITDVVADTGGLPIGPSGSEVACGAVSD